MSEQIQRQVSEIDNIKFLLPPPNDIMTKEVSQIDQKVVFKIDLLNNNQQHTNHHKQRHRTHHEDNQHTQNMKRSSSNVDNPFVEIMTLNNGYDANSLVFKKWDNSKCNERGHKCYFASLFLEIEGNRAVKLPQYKGMIYDDNLSFDSNFESANLMSVYKIGPSNYDLILQNDTNTKGYTQWFNFKISNKRNNFIARFNIVNLYKTKSLYNIGMKPMVKSQKSQKNDKNDKNDKNMKRFWRRKGYNIYYEKNDLNYEDNLKKCYKSLTFQYDFTIQNDTVQIAHGMPYDLKDLDRLLNSIKRHARVKVSTIGVTVMGRPIPLIKISSKDEENAGIPKKAIIFLGRQHPGQTPGSQIGQEVILQLLRNSIQTEFLISKFDIFIFPMVNPDGVALGNYRSNFAGYDLNRCWLRPDSVRQPEVYSIKSYIKKLTKKYKVQLILDFHGHSRKMGSFFYGNKYGPNYLLFPFIASKSNKNIIFQKSSFSNETQLQPKGSTARAVLGNMLKQTNGYVYTYEVSFYGNYKQEGIPFAFNEDHIKQLGKALVQSIYRTYLQMYKQEKTLKQSIFLKTLKNQLSEIKSQTQSCSGSDSEAEKQMEGQIQEINEFFDNKQIALNLQGKTESKILVVKRIDKQVSSKIKDLRQYGIPVEKYSNQIYNKITGLLDRNTNQNLKSVFYKLPSIEDQKYNANFHSPQSPKLENENFLKHLLLKQYQQENPKFIQNVQNKNGQYYARIRKYSNYADWMRVNGQTFQLRDRFNEKQPVKNVKYKQQVAHHSQKKAIQHLKNTILLTDKKSFKMISKDELQTKHLVSNNMMSSFFEVNPKELSQQQKQIKISKIKSRLNNKSTTQRQPTNRHNQVISHTFKIKRINMQQKKNPSISKQKNTIKNKFPVI